jgi:hypothetical protein
MQQHRLRPRVPTTFVALLGTCVSISPTSPPPPPPAPFHDYHEAAAASATVAALESTLAAPALQAFVGLAPMLSISGGRVALPVAPRGGMACAAAPALPVVRAFPVSATTSAFPDSLARRVLVFDSTTRVYRPSTDSSGPANGVRFTLYQVDTAAIPPLLPLFPLNAVGSMDLTVLSADSLRGTVQDAGGTLADYTLAPSGTQTSFIERLGGTISGPGGPFTFRDSTDRNGGTVTTVVTFTPANGDRFELTATRTVLDRYDDFYDLDLRFTHDTETVRIVGLNDTYCLLSSIDLIATVNDGSFAKVNNGASADDPLLTRADNRAFTTEQRDALLALIHGQRKLFGLMSALSWPGALTLAP